MKIGFDATKAFDKKNGYGRYSRSIIRILSQNHSENSYVLYTSKLSKDPSIKSLISPRHVAVRTPAYIVTKMNMGNIWRNTILGNTATKDGVDVFHGLNNELPIVVNKNLKTVVTIHNLHFIRYPHLYNSLDISLYKRRYKHACKVANKVVVPSKQSAEDLEAFFGINSKKIEVIQQGVHPVFKKEYAPYDMRKLCDKYALPEDFILTISHLDVLNNNALTTFKALALLKEKLDIPLVVVGNAHKNYLAALKSIASKEQMLNRLIILDEVPEEDLAKLFQICKIYINASTYPCDTTSIKEALYSKVPVICSRLPDFIEAGGLAPIYIQPGNLEELAYTIQNVLNNPSLTSNMIFQGEIHSQQFNDVIIADQLINVYNALVTKKNGFFI